MTIVDSDAPLDTRPLPPLGVTALFGRTVRLLKNAFLPLAGTSFVYFALFQIASLVIVWQVLNTGAQPVVVNEIADADAPTAYIALGIAAFVAVFLVFACLYGALLVVALKRDAGERADLGPAFRTGIRFALPMFVSFFVVGFLIVLGLSFFLVPGIWLVGVYGLVPVVMVAEGRARGVLGRTRRLTKEYRWPLVGFYVLLYLVFFVVSAVVAGIGVLIPIDPANMALLAARTLLIDAPVGAISTAFLIAGFAVAYRRLIEIKEGEGSEALRAVFE